MGLSGIFLILFLTVHLTGNLQLLYQDEGEAFNSYAYFMGHNGLIQFISKGNFALILLHAIIGIYLWVRNKAARGTERYAVQKTRAVNTHPGFAKNMWFLGIIIFVFIAIHLYQFWFQMKFGELGMVSYNGQEPVKDLYSLVKLTFTNLPFVLFYLFCMIIIGFHLWHGFQSAFQTLGVNHPKYSPFIRLLGKIYSVAIPFGFAIIPIILYLRNA